MSRRDFPKRTEPPEAISEDESSGIFTFPQGQQVAVLVSDERVQTELVDLLRHGPYLLGGTELVKTAGVVVADVALRSGDVSRYDERVAERVRDLRRDARADAAIILLLDRRWPPDAGAAAEAAGAFATIRLPLLAESVEAVVKSASANYAAQTRIADLTRQLDLQSHLTSLGRFTGGLHHELKNPLAVVEMNVNLVRDELKTLLEARELLRSVVFAPVTERAKRDQAARDFLAKTEANTGDLAAAIEDARTGLARMRVVFQRLQNFVRQEERPLESVDLQSLVADVVAETKPMLDGIHVEVVAEEPLHALAVRSLVHDILINLASNAATAARPLSSPRVRFHAYAAGERVVVSVRDNGPGIPPHEQGKIFEPFYTTRRSDGAAGLGLAICREYATHMGAELSFWTAPGRGACFRLHLRRA